uniref:Uncharacterized protein n=1 Tax=Candidatus Kentrum sp. LPFa TaxID=2126335 RepID=A0A450VZ79_9GAMM|nr:MAG: hypothetical protein BECKLPF1236A_GA0070988_100329 [Candidatus Kentron sp. LPFa]VFK26097.1 MAG: hypothetical protein BECKLPF1236C_GA0070990_100308 [Candidatus Kentron sp. LPFa]
MSVANSINPFEHSLSNQDWPKRVQGNVTEREVIDAYCNELKIITDAGWLKGPLFVAWDDWNLNKQEWDQAAPIHFIDEEAKRVYALTALGISASRELGIIQKEDRGMSFFVHRYLRRKRIIRLVKLDPNQQANVDGDFSSDIVTLKIPSLSVPLFSDLYCQIIIDDIISRRNLQSAILDWRKNSTQAKDLLMKQKTALDEIISPIIGNASKVLFDNYDDVEKRAVKDALTATVIFFSLGYNKLTETYFVPSRGFVREDKRGKIEECSGGIYFWCSNTTECKPLYIQSYDSYRGLRTSIVDWAEKNSRVLRKTSERNAKAAIMSRNLSHNIGSHALANPKLLQSLSKDIKANPEKYAEAEANLSIFHQYLQNRLDYIARSLNPGTERPEPLFFINEILNGLFRQAVLLETLLEDQGFGRNTIHFHVRTRLAAHGQKGDEKGFGIYSLSGRNGNGDGKNAGETELRRFRLTEGLEPVDTLMGVMGGMIGGQALYSFLENVMRNAAKYGAHRNLCSNVHIHLDLRDANICETEDHKRYFVMEVWENLSGDARVEGGTVAEALRGHLDTDLIDDRGEPITKGQGIQEMKMAAEFLSGGQLFKSDAESLACPDFRKTGECEADAYCRYIEGGQKRKNGAQPLRCYAIESAEGPTSTAETDAENPIVYQLLIPKAILAGVVDTNTAQPKTQQETYPGTDAIVRYGSVSDLAGTEAAFGVIPDSKNLDEAGIAERVREIREHHNALPFRLMVLTSSPERTKNWKDDQIIKSMLIGYKAGNEEDEHLPARRLHIVESETLQGIFTSETKPDVSFLGANGWDAALLMLYHHWLIAFKGVPHDNTWKLVIGFERSQDQVGKLWEKPLTLFDAKAQKALPARRVTEQESLDVHAAVEVHVCGRSKGGDPWPAFSSKGANLFTAEPIDRQVEDYFLKRQGYVVFDNHGQAVSGLRKRAIHFGVRCIHEFSGKENLSLFQSLESPPQEPFSFAWFVYSLLESALLNVAIVDERVAGAAVGPGILRPLNRAGIFPVFNLRDNGNRTPLDPSLEAKLSDSITDGSKEELKSEGVTLSPPAIALACQKQNDVEKTVHPPNKNADKSHPIHPLDAVIIHEGVVDVVLGKSVWKKEGLEQNLFALAPRVIRTSGRGSQPRHLSPRLPFMEFSELSETTYRALNKLILSKAVLGVFGPNPKKNNARNPE